MHSPELQNFRAIRFGIYLNALNNHRADQHYLCTWCNEAYSAWDMMVVCRQLWHPLLYLCDDCYTGED
jgi:hypothetical protein